PRQRPVVVHLGRGRTSGRRTGGLAMTAPTDLAGKVAVVTGGSSGLGAAISTALEDAGAKVVVADLKGSPPVDVTNDDDVHSLFASLDRLDVLVLSAAVEVRKPLLDTTDEEWQRVLDVNLK